MLIVPFNVSQSLVIYCCILKNSFLIFIFKVISICYIQFKKKEQFFLRNSFEYYQNERVVFFNWLIIKLLLRKFAECIAYLLNEQNVKQFINETESKQMKIKSNNTLTSRLLAIGSNTVSLYICIFFFICYERILQAYAFI